MKALYLTGLGALCAVLLCGLFSRHIHNACEELVALAEGAETAAEQDDYAAAEDSLSRFEALWAENVKGWRFLCDHDDLLRVDLALANARIFSDQEEHGHLLIECNNLKAAVVAIWEKELVRPENVI